MLFFICRNFVIILPFPSFRKFDILLVSLFIPMSLLDHHTNIGIDIDETLASAFSP